MCGPQEKCCCFPAVLGTQILAVLLTLAELSGLIYTAVNYSDLKVILTSIPPENIVLVQKCPELYPIVTVLNESTDLNCKILKKEFLPVDKT